MRPSCLKTAFQEAADRDLNLRPALHFMDSQGRQESGRPLESLPQKMIFRVEGLGAHIV